VESYLVVLKLDKGVNFRSLPIKPNAPYVLSRLLVILSISAVNHDIGCLKGSYMAY
jgi:hypothetical protein